MKPFLLIIALLFCSATLFAQNKVNPIIKSYGTVFEIPTADHKPDPAIDYKNIVELTENTRLKIPLLSGLDIIHGYKTVFPIPLALSLTLPHQYLQNAHPKGQ